MGDDLADLLEQRRAIDRVLQEKHAVDMAVLFTDIVGSTAYFEQRGDVEGLALVHRHNDLLFPVVTAHNGRIVKTIGDAIMAVYPKASDAVASAVAMMRALDDDGRASGKEPIRIRIGLHCGSVLKDKDDVFGDTVNVAARVNSAAQPSEILVSTVVVAALPPQHAFVVEERAPVAAKGKNAPVEVKAIVWRAADITDTTARVAATRLFVLSVEQGPQGLRVSAIDGDVGKGTVKRHVDVDTTPAELSALAEEMSVLAHEGGRDAYANVLIEKGRALTKAALPDAVVARLASTENRALRLHVDDAVARVPWELCRLVVDGEEQWLGCAFALGRVVSAPDLYGTVKTGAGLGKKVVVIADPAGDLEHARKEGELIAGLYQSVGVDVVSRSGPLTRGQLLEAVADCRVLHLATHVDRTQHGIVCSDGVVDGKALAAVFAHACPALVFANACHASTAAPWATSTLTKSLLDCGVRHVLAPLWAVPDRDALAFALRVTEAALAGAPLGEAVRRGRLALVDNAKAPLSFAGYVLFGDPRTTLPFEGPKLQGAGRTRSAEIVPVPSPTSTPSSKVPLFAAAVGIAGVLALGTWFATRPGAVTTTTTTTAALPAPAPAPAPVAVKRSGPVRLSVLPFKGGSAGLAEGLTEALVTGLAGAPGITLVERGQIDVDIAELDFQQSKYVDAATRARLGKINGAEVVLIGALAMAGEEVRLTARYVDVETGEVLNALKTTGSAKALFDLQDQLVDVVKASLPKLTARVRP
ncbi:MAG: adenylate/guanylate cyclase domain-containing protein [Deltaproteobacteria bacterium]|nr:adenylate/guanylate cyclase domain-containing protein [Deltaproteobacteria bacterium]